MTKPYKYLSIYSQENKQINYGALILILFAFAVIGIAIYEFVNMYF